MLTLNDGRSELWQWDTGRTLNVDVECSQVHFSNKVFGRSIDVDVVGGMAIIPDVLLQTDKDLTAWVFVGTPENGYTKISKVFKVNKRNKPSDYVFTPPEQTTLGEILKRLDDIESSQDPDAIKNAVDDYLANNPIKVEEKDPTVPEWAKQPTPPDVKIPDKLPNPHSITFTGAVNASYDGSDPVEIIIPGSGGNVDLTGVTEYHASNNLYDPENLVGTHIINGSSVSGLSNWIPVKAKTKYASNKATQYYFFDSNKNYLSGTSLVGTTVVFTAPQDGFVLLNRYGATDIIVVEGTSLGNYYEGYYALKEILTKRVSKADNNSWVGKKWLAIGDSLTDPQYADKGYPYLVSKALGLTLTNVGASGKVMNYFVDLIPGYADDFDLVTVLLGSNNQGYNCPVGSLNDGVDYTSNNSFYAQAQKVAEVLMAKYPSAVIAFMTPIRRTDADDNPKNNDEGYHINALGLTTEPYAEAVKEVADYYGLPCLDLYHNGINPKSEWMRQLYFVNADGTHPNNDGHAKYTAPVIKDFLESLAPFGERIVVEPDIPKPDEPGTDEPVANYTVTNTLTNAANSNSAVSVEHGASYSATITANDGYELDSVTVTMGGTDISAYAVNGGTITIASVTGNIVITATATKTEVDSGEAVLVHSYLGTSVPEDKILVDQTGTFDLPLISGATVFGTDYSHSDAPAIEAGDSISIKFVNAMRNTVYYTQSVGVDTSGRSGIHIGINGSTDTDGRVRVTLGGKPSDGGAFGDGTIACGYRTADGNLDSIDSGIAWVKGETHTVTITVNATDNTMKLYVDGSLTGEKIMTSNLQVDGFTVTVRNEFPFDRLEVYKGIITDVG